MRTEGHQLIIWGKGTPKAHSSAATQENDRFPLNSSKTKRKQKPKSQSPKAKADLFEFDPEALREEPKKEQRFILAVVQSRPFTFKLPVCPSLRYHSSTSNDSPDFTF